jgi:hypothetical protein
LIALIVMIKRGALRLCCNCFNITIPYAGFDTTAYAT